MKLITNIGFIGLKNLEINNKNIKRLRYATTTRNLFDFSLLTGFYASVGGYQYKNIQLKPNTTYAISTTNSNYFNNVAGTKPYAKLITENNNELLFIGHSTNPALSIYPGHSEIFTTDSTGKIGLAFNCPPFTEDAYKQFYEEWFANMQIEEGSTATPYVPYGYLDLGIIPSNSGYILNKYNNLSEELLEENVEKDNINYHIPDKTNILLNKVEGKTNKIVQLIDKTVFVTSGTKVGLTFTCNRTTGAVTVNGTATAGSFWNPSGGLPLINNHKYLICGNYVGSELKLGLLNQGGVGYDSGNGGIVSAVTSVETPRNTWGITWDNGTTFNNVTIYPQIFDLTAMYGYGKEPTTVEQFKKDYPQFFDEKLDGIWNVRNSGISTTGKNLFDINKWITHQYDVGNGTLVERLSNGVICQGDNGTDDGVANYSNGWFRPMYYQYPNSVYLQAGTYTLSADYTMIENSVVNTARVNCYLYGDHDYNIANTTSVTVGNTVRIKNTYTVEEGYYYPIFTLNSGKAKIENIQIELNSTATTYEPYTENKIDLLSTQTLNGINEVNDYIEVIDKGNGLYDLKKTQNIASVDLGTLVWAVDGSNFSSSSISSVIKPPTNNNSVGNYTCQKYVNVALSKSFVDGDFGVNSSGGIYFRNSAYTTAAAFKTAMNGVILYYQLKTPVITTIATNLTYNQVSAIRTNGGLLLVNDNNNQKYVQPDVTLKENYQYKS